MFSLYLLFSPSHTLSQLNQHNEVQFLFYDTKWLIFVHIVRGAFLVIHQYCNVLFVKKFYHVTYLPYVTKNDCLYTERETNQWLCIVCGKSGFPFNHYDDEIDFLNVLSELWFTYSRNLSFESLTEKSLIHLNWTIIMHLFQWMILILTYNILMIFPLAMFSITPTISLKIHLLKNVNPYWLTHQCSLCYIWIFVAFQGIFMS